MKITGRIEKVGNTTGILIESRGVAGHLEFYGHANEFTDGQEVQINIAPVAAPMNQAPIIEEELACEKRQQRIKEAVANALS